MNLADFARRADEIIASADQVLATAKPGAYGTEYNYEWYSAFRAAALSFLANSFGENHTYHEEFARVTNDCDGSSIKGGRGVLVAARGEVAGGWTVTARGIVSAEIFGDFIEMAQHLLAEGYKDPAAVVTGSVLEEHLRQLAGKHAVPVEFEVKGDHVPKKANVLNADLKKAGVYNALNEKNVIAWLDLRNKAAHGHYTEYTAGNVDLMIQGILQFMASFPV